MADSYWFKISPEKYLTIAGRIPDGTQRAEFLSICMHCLAVQGGLPDDDEEIAFITAIALERITALRPYLNRLCVRENGEILPAVALEAIAERQEYGAKKAEAGQKGGKQKQVNASSAKQTLAVLDSAVAKPSQTNKQTNRQTDKQETAVAVFAHEPTGDDDAITETCDQIAAVVRDYLKIPDTSGWKTQDEISDIAIKLDGIGATADQVADFIQTRRKPPGQKYWVQDFLVWRGSLNGAGSPRSNGLSRQERLEARNQAVVDQIKRAAAASYIDAEVV